MSVPLYIPPSYPKDNVAMKHIRNERLTRDKLPGWVGKELPSEIGFAWCGADCSGLWIFQDVDHAILELKYIGSIAPCIDCLLAIKAVIDAELYGI